MACWVTPSVSASSLTACDKDFPQQGWFGHSSFSRSKFPTTPFARTVRNSILAQIRTNNWLSFSSNFFLQLECKKEAVAQMLLVDQQAFHYCYLIWQKGCHLLYCAVKPRLIIVLSNHLGDLMRVGEKFNLHNLHVVDWLLEPRVELCT